MNLCIISIFGCFGTRHWAINLGGFRNYIAAGRRNGCENRGPSGVHVRYNAGLNKTLSVCLYNEFHELELQARNYRKIHEVVAKQQEQQASSSSASIGVEIITIGLCV